MYTVYVFSRRMFIPFEKLSRYLFNWSTNWNHECHKHTDTAIAEGGLILAAGQRAVAATDPWNSAEQVFYNTGPPGILPTKPSPPWFIPHSTLQPRFISIAGSCGLPRRQKHRIVQCSWALIKRPTNHNEYSAIAGMLWTIGERLTSRESFLFILILIHLQISLARFSVCWSFYVKIADAALHWSQSN